MSKYDKIENFIFVCKDKDCKNKGAKNIEKAFEKSIKKMNLHKNSKIIQCACTNRCKEAPVAIINTTWVGNVSVDNVDELVKRLLTQ